MDQPTSSTEIQNTFKTLAMQLGGIAFVHGLDDDTAWAIARAVDNAFRRTVRTITGDQAPGTGPAPRKHPAFTHLINSIETN